ncbi:hypothetical protein POTOM_036645 [Populus tomentosa]|uniref:Uncharacterized protein n=1 Tax=Populus tomentosa TaxID=118781 RepID=A0A8X8CNB2_POPTO|nr:hypothetical protein POTOM_036645 [Populus tomentosa]
MCHVVGTKWKTFERFGELEILTGELNLGPDYECRTRRGSWRTRHRVFCILTLLPPDSCLKGLKACEVELISKYERRIGELLGVDCGGLVGEEKRLVIELMPKVLPLLKDGIKESSIDKSVDGDEISAAPARAY